ncbi:MAG: UrcA family protein [Porphyrobacter sp.]|nr:UrcA family protein [Porphyrobacter sp.]
MKTLAIAAAAIGLACTAAPAFAKFAPLTITVRHSDLDLATAEGQKTLDQRIEKAVRTVCRVTDIETGSRVMSDQKAACLAQARANAHEQVALLMENQQRGG